MKWTLKLQNTQSPGRRTGGAAGRPGDWAGFLPLCDFRAPKEPLYYDSTAGASGLLEIVEHVPELEKPLYQRAALNILKAMEEQFCNWNVEEDRVLGMGEVAYHEQGERQQVSIIYGDYFFTEAILRLLDKDFFIW